MNGSASFTQSGIEVPIAHLRAVSLRAVGQRGKRNAEERPPQFGGPILG